MGPASSRSEGVPLRREKYKWLMPWNMGAQSAWRREAFLMRWWHLEMWTEIFLLVTGEKAVGGSPGFGSASLLSPQRPLTFSYMEERFLWNLEPKEPCVCKDAYSQPPIMCLWRPEMYEFLLQFLLYFLRQGYSLNWSWPEQLWDSPISLLLARTDCVAHTALNEPSSSPWHSENLTFF